MPSIVEWRSKTDDWCAQVWLDPDEAERAAAYLRKQGCTFVMVSGDRTPEPAAKQTADNRE